MAQFDVHGGIGRPKGYVVELQADFILDRVPVRIVAPMVPSGKVTPITKLTPQVRFDGDDYLVLIHQLASVPAQLLQHPVGSLVEDQDAIKFAVDLLFTGF
jgi:toxin CcdB